MEIKKNSAKKVYVCYRLIEILKEHDESFETRDAKNNFSFLLLATGQGPIKKYIGLPTWNDIEKIEKPIPENKKENLKFLFECLFDNKDKKRLIKESRDITNKLSKIFDDEDATAILETDGDIKNAFDMIGGELIGLNKLSGDATKKLETINGKLSGIDIKKEVLSHKAGEKLQKISTKNQRITADIVKKFENG